ncbi:MAG: hypothetical protein RL609_1799 [Bacteroidota bacterium]|jgi:hypothetical protein
MLKNIRYRCLNSKENYALIFFHFLHSSTAILILLLLGQFANKTDATKSKILHLIAPNQFSEINIAYWIVGLLIAKFIATFFRNYFHQVTNFQIHNKILKEILFKYHFHDNNSFEKETTRYVKAYSKGVLLLVSDFFLLAVIYFLLSKLSNPVSNFWLLFIIVGIIIRSLVVKYFINSKYAFKNAVNAMNRKWNFIFNNHLTLIKDQQFKKELNILNNREKTAASALNKYASHHAWTAGFFPVYFYIFLFVIVWNFKSNNEIQSNFLQIILIIIYSQGALLRIFKTPAYWKEMVEIEAQWSRNISEYSSTPEIFQKKKSTKNNFEWDLSNYTKPMLIRLFSDSLEKSKQSELIATDFYSSIFIFDLNRKIIGDTFLGAVLTDKESEQLQLLINLSLQAPPEDWLNFDWQNKLDLDILSPRQLIWIYFFKAILHPGRQILFIKSTKNQINDIDISLFQNIAISNNKKIYILDENDF